MRKVLLSMMVSLDGRVILGAGSSLFGEVNRRLELELAETKRFEAGVVALRYRRGRQGS